MKFWLFYKKLLKKKSNEKTRSSTAIVTKSILVKKWMTAEQSLLAEKTFQHNWIKLIPFRNWRSRPPENIGRATSQWYFVKNLSGRFMNGHHMAVMQQLVFDATTCQKGRKFYCNFQRMVKMFCAKSKKKIGNSCCSTESQKYGLLINHWNAATQSAAFKDFEDWRTCEELSNLKKSPEKLRETCLTFKCLRNGIK